MKISTLWDAMNPIARVSESAPPFLVIQGTHDTLVFVEEAREFVRALREKSRASVAYLEMTGAQHAFDIFHSPRSVARGSRGSGISAARAGQTDSRNRPSIDLLGTLERWSPTTAGMDVVGAGHARAKKGVRAPFAVCVRHSDNVVQKVL